MRARAKRESGGHFFFGWRSTRLKYIPNEISCGGLFDVNYVAKLFPSPLQCFRIRFPYSARPYRRTRIYNCIQSVSAKNIIFFARSNAHKRNLMKDILRGLICDLFLMSFLLAYVMSLQRAHFCTPAATLRVREPSSI